MPRTLRAARVSVRPGDEAAYVAAVGALAERFRAHGGHVWLFRPAGTPGDFLEFRECGSAPALEAAETDPAVAPLLERLARLARYAPDAARAWTEVRLSGAAGAGAP